MTNQRIGESIPDMLNEAAIQQYEEDGVAVLRNVISSDWREKLAEAIECDIENPGPYVHAYQAEDGAGRFHGNLRIWENDPDFRAYCFESPLPEMAATIFGSTHVNLHYDQLFVKEPGTVNRTRWHNDQPYWHIRGWQVLTFWTSLNPVTEDSGTLEFIPGSHKWDRWFQPERFGKTAEHDPYERNPDYEPMPDIEAARDKYEIVSWGLEPGDALLFHGLTVHGAGGNLRPDVRRRGYAVRYTGDDVVYDTRPGTNEANRSETHADADIFDSDQFPVVWRA